MLKRIIRRFSTVKLNNLRYDNQKEWDLVVLHGLLGSHKNFRSLMKNRQLSEYANVHMVDNRNHGESPHTAEHSYQLMAKDLKKYLEESGLRKVILMGHSMGGGVVYTFSKLYPQLQKIVKQLVIVDMPLKIKERKVNENILNGLLNIDLTQPRETIMKQIEAIGNNRSISDFLKTNLRQRGDGGHEWIANIPALQQNYSNIVSEIISSPTEWENNVDIMYGEKSPTCTRAECERLGQVYKNFKEENIHKIENAGHWLHFDNPAQFTKVLINIVKNNVRE